MEITTVNCLTEKAWDEYLHSLLRSDPLLAMIPWFMNLFSK